jgi:hypothetical protein
MISIRTPALLLMGVALLATRGNAQEVPPAPTAEGFLKIINEQLAVMANTTFEISFTSISSGSAPGVAQAAGGGEMVFDANGNVVGTLTQPGPAVPPVPVAPPTPAGRMVPPNRPMMPMPPMPPMPPVKLRARVQFASVAEYYVGQASLEGKLLVEHFGSPDRGYSQALHSTKEYVTDIKEPRAYTVAFGLLPQYFVEHYKSVASAKTPGDLKWTLENLGPNEATLVLRDSGGRRMQAVFALPSNMCTSLKTYASNDVEQEHIQPTPGAAAGKWPFLAASYTSTSRGGTLTKSCDISSATPLQPGMMRPSQQPAGFTRITYEERMKRFEKHLQKMKR